MSREQLDKAVREHYEAEELSPEALERLRAVAQEARAAARPAGRRRMLLVAAAALVLVGALVSFIVANQTPAAVRAAAEEVARNHQKVMLPEVFGDAYAELGASLDRLDFELATPRDLPQGYVAEGARHCSLRDQVAAQLRLVDPDGRVHTLYGLKDSATFSDIEPQTVEVGSLRVRFWREQGLFFGLASPSR